MVQDARQRVENLTPQQVADELRRGDVLLVDLREPDEPKQTGAIAGAISAPRGMLEFWADPSSPYHRQEFQPDRRVILHCASGGRSALASAMLNELGYSRVAHLGGGLKAWSEAGQPVERTGR